MKKIVSAIALGAAAASLATAEVTVSQNFRFRPDLLKVESIDKTVNATDATKNKDAYTKTTFGDLDSYGACSDTLGIAGKTDFAGFKVDLTLTSGITSTGNLGGNEGKGETVAIDNYYGWLTWGAFNLTGGVYDSRFTSRGNYTATEEGILDKEFAKGLGLSGSLVGYLDADGKQQKWGTYGLKDFGNVSQVDASNYLSFLADYTLDDIGGGKLLLKGGLVENDAAGSSKLKNTDLSKTPFVTTKNDDGNTTFQQSAGYVFEAAWANDEVAKVDVIFKKPVNKLYGVGVYITPMMIPNAKNVVLGFTYGTKKDTFSAFAVDARAQFNITPEAVFALGAKYESLTPDGADAETGLSVAAEGSYKLNDLVTLALDLGYFNYDLDDNDDADDGSQSFVASGRAKFSAGKNAAITTALRYTAVLNAAKDAGKTTGTFDIPVVLRIKM